LQKCKERLYTEIMENEDDLKLLFKRAGGMPAIARLFEISEAAVGQWAGRKVPSERVIAICEMSAWKVTPHEMRPDVYPHPEDGLPGQMRCNTVAESCK
jgi:DNA-binding transcriptional regulator YdaS (Cro superfamily)